MSRSFYDIDPAGEVLCTYTDGGGREALKSVSVDALPPLAVPALDHTMTMTVPPPPSRPACLPVFADLAR